MSMTDTLTRDLRYAARALWRSPGFTAVAVLSVGIGVGGNVALFGLVDALLFRSLPVVEPDRLVYVQRTDTATGKRLGVDRTMLESLGQLPDVVEGVTAQAALNQPLVTIGGAAEPGRLIVRATAEFFSVLGVPARIGRLDSPSPAAVISDRFWRDRFQGSPSVLGQPMTIDGQSYPIVGVAGRDFVGVTLDASVDAWLLASPPAFVAPNAIARLRPDVPIERARGALATIVRNLPMGGSDPDRIVTEVLPASQGDSTIREQYRRPLLALTGLVVILLVTTCTNIANLLVLRHTKRTHEFVVRASLGARRSRLVGQLLVESALVAALGAAAAWLFAKWGVSTLLAALPVASVPEQLRLHADGRTLGLLATLSALVAVLFGFAPAVRGTRVDLGSALKSTQPTATGRGMRRLGLSLVAGQVALSVMLVAGAGLFLETLRNMAQVDLGFSPSRLVQIELAGRMVPYRPEEVPGLHQRLLDAVSVVPGVESATVSFTPLYPPWAAEKPALQEGYAAGVVGPRYFETLRIPLLRGRLFTQDDVERGQAVSIVTESFAREFFPGEDPIGKRAGFGSLEVVGVVRDARTSNVRWHEPTVYRLGLRIGRVMSAILVRTSVEPSTVTRPLQEAVSGVDPRLFTSATPVEAVINRSIARERLVAGASAFFGLVGLVLAGMGVFGVAALAVAQRTSELGLRIALGASRSRVVRESLRDTAVVCAGGLALGSAAAVLALRVAGHHISGLLFGVEPAGWGNPAAAAALMLLIVVAACILPALRATRIDPLAAIRTE
jgi:predicted permease